MTRSGPFKLTLAALAAVAIVSCDQQPEALSAPELQPNDALLGSLLVSCSPQSSATATAEIGPSGGSISVAGHTLSIPAGALSQSVVITATSSGSSSINVDFEPEGLTFAQPATLTLSYAHCSGLALLLPKRIAYTTNALLVLEYLLSADNLLNRTVSADLDHFSKYAVAW